MLCIFKYAGINNRLQLVDFPPLCIFKCAGSIIFPWCLFVFLLLQFDPAKGCNYFSPLCISNSWTIYWFHISPCTIMFHISRHWAGTWEGVQYHNTQIGHLSAPPARHFRICYSMHKSVTEQDSNSCDHLTSLVIIILWSFDAWIGWKGAHYQPWPLMAMLHALFNTMPLTHLHTCKK